MNELILNKLLDFITESFMIEKEEIHLEKSLIDEGIIDSFGLVEIASFLEDEFQIEVTEEKMIRENFGSVLKIVAFVENEQKIK